MIGNDELRRIVAFLRKWLGVEDHERIDVLACLNSPTIWTIDGVKRLTLKAVPDAEMGGADAITTSGKDWTLIRVKVTVLLAAKSWFGRARMTLAHELAHVVLNHSHGEFARLTGVRSYLVGSGKGDIESAANKFAALFLVKPEFLEKYKTAGEISEAFAISMKAAIVCFTESNKKHEKPKVVGLFAELQNRLNAPNSIRLPTIDKVTKAIDVSRAIDVPKAQMLCESSDSETTDQVQCPGCGGLAARSAGGNKFVCMGACKRTYDCFQDGDRLGDDRGLANFGEDDATR